MRSEGRAQRSRSCCTPIIRELPLKQSAVVNERVDRHQFDRCDAERSNVIHDRLTSESSIRAAQPLGNVGMPFGEALDVSFINNRLVPGHVLPARFASPVEVGVNNHAFWHEGRAIAFVECPVVAGFDLVAKYSRMPPQPAHVRTRIRIKQELARIEAVAGIGFVRAANAIAVKGAGP